MVEASCDPQVIHPLVLAELELGRDQITLELEHLKALSERETLACGNVLNAIVENVRAMIADAGRTLEATKGRSAAVASGFLAEFQADVLAQEAAVREVLALADSVDRSIKEIRKLTQQAKILALNAKIESSRIGEQGRGFAVIADYLSAMSTTMTETFATMSAMVGGMRQSLHPVVENWNAMQGRTTAFVDDVTAATVQGDAGSAVSGSLAQVMSLSNEALSHLQFQDGMAQRLTFVSNDLRAVGLRVGRVLDGERSLETFQRQDRSDDGQPPAGQVMLF